MATRTNFIVVVKRKRLPAALRAMEPIIAEYLGPLQTIAVQNFVLETVEDRRLDTQSPKVPDFNDDEIVALYPPKMTSGALVLSHENEFDTLTMSIPAPPDLQATAEQLWTSVASEAVCVLVGEELEVSADAIQTFLETRSLANAPRLCELAIMGEHESESPAMNRPRQALLLRR